MGDSCAGFQLVDGVPRRLEYGQDSLVGVQDAKGNMVRAGVWYSNVCVVVRLDGFTVMLRGTVE